MSSNYHTPITTGAAANAGTINTPLSDLDAALYDLLHGDLAWTQLNYGSPVALTISGGAITITQSYHTVDTEGAAASDDLTTINGGVLGDVLTLRTANDGRDVTIKHNAGNIFLSGGFDVVLNTTSMAVELYCLGSVWVDLAGEAVSGPYVRIVPRTVLGAPASNIDLTSISQLFSILELHLELRSDVVATSDDVNITFNADATAANYFGFSVRIQHSSSVTTAENLGATAGLRSIRGACGASSPSGYRSNITILIPDYTATTRPRHISGYGYTPADDTTGNLHVLQFGGTWKDAANALTRITVDQVSGTNWETGSAYELLGIL